MKLLEGLNEPQRQAVTHSGGPLLIFAGAGSGKTRTLTHRIAYLIQQQNVPASRILAVTFTNKAAREMRERLEHLVGRDAQRLWMGTFHALCAKMLRMHGDQIGIDPRFVIFDSDDSARVMKDVLREANLDADRYPPGRMLGRISDAKNNLRTPDDLAAVAARPNERILARLYKAYQDRLRAAHALDFDDLLGEAVRLLRDGEEAHEYWPKRFLHVLIDEFQDVNEAQFKWAQALARIHRNICVVGDDDQCVAPGSQVLTPQGKVAIEQVQAGETVVSGAGHGTTAPAVVQAARTRSFNGQLVQATTRGGRVLRVTPNHMCFARLGVHADVHYVYLMYRQDKGYRIGITVGARSDGRHPDLINGLQVRANQEHADKVWVLRVCPTRAEAAYYENLYTFEYGIPTTIFHVAGRGELHWTQQSIDRLYAAIDTPARAARLMAECGLDAAHPHYRPGGLAGLDMPHRMVVHLTAFGGNAPSLQAPWFAHRVWLNTTDRVLEEQIIDGDIATRPEGRNTWRVERSYKELGRSAQLAEELARSSGGADVARWATLTAGDKFAFQPAAHLRPTMIVPAWQDGTIVEDEIVQVEHIDYNGPVYDLDVEHLHNYIVDGIVVHNSIYAWRGANVKLILEFESSYPDATVVRLEQNYRSTQNILDAAHGVISRNLGRRAKRLWTEGDHGPQLILHGAPDAQEEALWVVRQVQMLAREKHLQWSDFAILCRINAQSRPFEEAFMRARLPLRLVGTQRFYERKEIKDLIAYLKVIYNPNDSVALGRIINVPVRGIGATTIQKLAELARESGRSMGEVIMDEAALAGLGRAVQLKIAPLRQLLGVLQQDAHECEPVAELVARVIERIDYLEFLQRERSRERSVESIDRAANVQEFLSAAALFDERMQKEALAASGDIEDNQSDEYAPLSRGELGHLGLFLETVALEDNAGAKSGQTDEAVTLMTLHSAKGLEFPIVFMAGMEQGLLPHSRAVMSESDEELEEERRLCYVGLTRAEQQVYLCYANQRTLHGRTESTQPSQFIDEIPAALLQRSGTATASAASARRLSTDWGASRSIVDTPPTFRVGDRLKHPTFGEGLVVNASPSGGAGEWVEVAFLGEGIGKKKLVVAYAPLEKVS